MKTRCFLLANWAIWDSPLMPHWQIVGDYRSHRKNLVSIHILSLSENRKLHIFFNWHSLKNAFVHWTTENRLLSDKTWERIVWGFGTFPPRPHAWTGPLTARRSWTNLHSSGWTASLIIVTEKVGVGTRESLLGTITCLMPTIVLFF